VRRFFSLNDTFLSNNHILMMFLHIDETDKRCTEISRRGLLLLIIRCISNILWKIPISKMCMNYVN